MERNINAKSFLYYEVTTAIKDYNIHYSVEDVIDNTANFIAENMWWGIEPQIKGKDLMISEEDTIILHGKLQRFFEMLMLPPTEKYDYLLRIMAVDRPVLSSAFRDFVYAVEIPYETVYSALDYLVCRNETGDLELITDVKLSELMENAFHDLPKAAGNMIGFFFSWLRQEKKVCHVMDDGNIASKRIEYKTNYYRDYVMLNRVDMTIQKTAYSQDEYLELMYYLLNDSYISRNDMYRKAAESKDYADTWLFLSLHFVCALRHTDLERIPHPELTRESRELLDIIIEGRIDVTEMKGYSFRMMEWMYYMSMKPNKERRFSGIPDIRFHIPTSLEYHFGILFAVCEAHHRLSGANGPLVRCISDYEHIRRYMGDEIGYLFLDADFRSRRANKAYMQAFQLYTKPILGDNSIENTMGYILASMARSHKGSCSSFAKTTAEYLKDAAFSGLSTEFVAMELFERGVLSTIPSMLLKIVTGGEYGRMEPEVQTQLIQTLNMSPMETERLVSFAVARREQAVEFIGEMLTKYDGEDRRKLVISILHRISTGQAPAKNEQTECLLHAMGHECTKSNCISCPYQLMTKTAVFHLVCEYNRLLQKAKKSGIQEEKERYKWIIRERILPLISDTLTAMEDEYGPEATKELYRIIQETREAS